MSLSFSDKRGRAVIWWSTSKLDVTGNDDLKHLDSGLKFVSFNLFHLFPSIAEQHQAFIKSLKTQQHCGCVLPLYCNLSHLMLLHILSFFVKWPKKHIIKSFYNTYPSFCETDQSVCCAINWHQSCFCNDLINTTSQDGHVTFCVSQSELTKRSDAGLKTRFIDFSKTIT